MKKNLKIFLVLISISFYIYSCKSDVSKNSESEKVSQKIEKNPELNFNSPQEAIDFIVKLSNMSSEEVMKFDDAKWGKERKQWVNSEQSSKYDVRMSKNRDGNIDYSGHIEPSNEGQTNLSYFLKWRITLGSDGSIKESELHYQNVPFSYEGDSHELIGRRYDLHYGDDFYDRFIIWGDNFEGDVVNIYKNDTLKFGTYFKGKLVGRYIEGWKDESEDQMLKVNEFRNKEGELDGEQTYFDGCGRLTKKETYKDGEIISRFTYFGGNDKCHMKKKLLVKEEKFKNGLLDGVVKSYKTSYYWIKGGGMAPGEVRFLDEVKTYEKGVLNGEYTQYFQPVDGVTFDDKDDVELTMTYPIYEKGNYLDGHKNGTWKTFHQNGRVRSEGMYLEGGKDGIWSSYDNQGELTSKSDETKK